jgi:hypothetical protein
MIMIRRRDREVCPALEGLEWRLALSHAGGGPDGGRHDAVDVDANDHDADAVDRDDDRDRNDRDGRGGQDNGHWEPKPIGNSSTRPTIPTGPTGPVR